MSPDPGFRPATRHADLGERFFDAVEPARFPAHVPHHRSQPWAERTGFGALTEAEWLDHPGRFAPLPGGVPEPLALRHHGHQFRSCNPDLGDGRGVLFAQGHGLRDGRLPGPGTKGSGRTPCHRGADGRLTLKGGVPEVLATAMPEAPACPGASGPRRTLRWIMPTSPGRGHAPCWPRTWRRSGRRLPRTTAGRPSGGSWRRSRRWRRPVARCRRCPDRPNPGRRTALRTGGRRAAKARGGR